MVEVPKPPLQHAPVGLALSWAGYRLPLFSQVTKLRGGNPVIKGTRIGVHDVVGLIVNGSTVDNCAELP
jgi:hypothetical protein